MSIGLIRFLFYYCFKTSLAEVLKQVMSDIFFLIKNNKKAFKHLCSKAFYFLVSSETSSGGERGSSSMY
jgi:hypothetical protein